MLDVDAYFNSYFKNRFISIDTNKYLDNRYIQYNKTHLNI